MCSKVNISNSKSQTNNKHILTLSHQIEALSAFMCNLSLEVGGSRKLAILDEIVRMKLRGKYFYKSQETVAEDHNVCRETINRDWADFMTNGLLYVMKRGYRETQLTCLGQLFYIPKFKKILSRWIPSLKELSTDLSTENVTPLNCILSEDNNNKKEGAISIKISEDKEAAKERKSLMAQFMAFSFKDPHKKGGNEAYV
jgi:hypothetical protein